MTRPLLRLAVALAFLAAAGSAAADLLVPKSGRPVRGALVRQTDEEVVFNPYWSKHPEMVYEVIRLPAKRVKRVEIRPHPEVEVFRRLAARTAGDLQALKDIAAYARSEKLKAHARMCLALAVAEHPDDEDALVLLGGASKWKRVKEGNVHLDGELREALKTYVATDDVEARRRQAAEIARLGFEGKPVALERMRRSASQPTGLQVDRPLAWGSDRHPGAVYTLYVPRAYDPTVPWPLLLGLHGGGADGKREDEVVGSGRSAMNFYRDLAERHGYLVACPDALRAPWGAPGNEEMVRALLEELKHLYHVDVDRVYLTGHSMGGFGTWHLGPRMAEELAAISPMAGGGAGNIGALVSTKTPVFIYHSEDDYVRVDSDRRAAKQLQGTDLDFVYTELPDKGHALPESIRHELFAFLGPRRRYDRKHKDVWPRSSFLGKTSKDEVRYLGDPEALLEGDVETLDEWIDHLRLGGGRAATAVGRIAEAKPEGAVGAVVKILRDKRVSHDARAWAARALGELGDVAACSSLRKVVVQEAVRDQARVAVEAARALAALDDAEAGRALERAIEAWTAYYQDHLMPGDEVRFSDWQRAVPTLAALVDAWASLPAKGDAGALDATVVKRVLLPKHRVQTSERVPQDPAAARKALIAAVEKAYVAWDAEADLRDRLREASAP